MAKKIKTFTQSQARAYELCLHGTKSEIERAYNQASILGQGELCDMYLKELGRR